MFRPPGVVRLKEQQYMAGRSNPLNNAISMQKTQTIGNTLAELDMILFETTEKKNI